MVSDIVAHILLAGLLLGLLIYVVERNWTDDEGFDRDDSGSEHRERDGSDEDPRQR
jgi:hypothetical protein